MLVRFGVGLVAFGWYWGAVSSLIGFSVAGFPVVYGLIYVWFFLCVFFVMLLWLRLRG